MEKLISPKLAGFAIIKPGEEAVDQAKYHYQSLASGTASLDFFGTTMSGAAGNERDSNIPKANALVDNPKRFILEGICVDFIPGVLPSQTETDATFLNTFINDMWRVCSVGAFQLTLIDTVVMTLAPLFALPAGRGLGVVAATMSHTLSGAANRSASIAYATNGLPTRQAIRWLKAPFPVQAETSVKGKVTFTTGPTLAATGRLGVVCEGVEIRPAVAG